MSCIKTGFHAFLEPHQLFLYGDAFDVGDAYLFRICETSREPIQARKHFTIRSWDLWFDESATSMDRNSTMVSFARDVTNHGYDGIDVCR